MTLGLLFVPSIHGDCFDAVEIRYWDSLKECWNPLRCDDELGVMFASNAETRSCNLEITVIQRKRGQRCEKTAGGIGVEEGVGHVGPGQLLLVLLVLLELVQQVQVPLQLLLNVALIDQRISLIQLWKRHCLMHLFYLMMRMRNFTQVMSSTTMMSIQHMKSTFLQNFQILMMMRGKRIMTWELLRMQMRIDL